MARLTETIWQSDFALGAVRPEAVERDDTALIERSVKEALNTIVLTTGQTEQRPGTLYLADTEATQVFEMVLGGGVIYEVEIRETGITLRQDNTIIFSLGFDWTAFPFTFGSPTYADLDFWAIADPDALTIIIGSQYTPPQRLFFNGVTGVWNFAAFNFGIGEAGQLYVPFWRHYPDVTIQPSARTGSITVTASQGIWTTEHESMFIRYNDRQIQLDTRTSATVMQATVKEELSPTFDVTVASAAGFSLGEAVEGATSGCQGVITNIAGAVITVLVTDEYNGFTGGENFIGPKATTTVSSFTSAASLADTFLWDMQLWTAEHGYPGSAAQYGGRLYFCDFPNTPTVFAASAAQDIRDFRSGPNEGDGFTEALGSNVGGALKHIVSAEDLLFLTTHGLFYQGARDGRAITPETIAPVQFSRLGCASVRPVAVDDGCAFVGVNDKQVHAAVLAGDIYRSWRVEPITRFHPHLIDEPVQLGASSSGSDRPELYITAVMSDGTAAVCQWNRQDDELSWRPWSTNGLFKQIYQVGSKLHAVVERTVNGSTVKFRERFEYDCYVDAMTSLNVTAANPEGVAGVGYLGVDGAVATHLTGENASVYFEGFDMGDNLIRVDGWPDDGSGNKLTYPDTTEGFAQIGIKFDLTIVPWSRRSARTQRGLREVKRLVQMYVTVQQSGIFEINGRAHGGYRTGEDVTLAPPLRDDQVKMTFLGSSDYERIEITKPRPGPLRLLKLGYKVVV